MIRGPGLPIPCRHLVRQPQCTLKEISMSIGRQLVVLGSGNRVVATRPACQCEQHQFKGQASGHSIKGKWALDQRRCMLRSSTLRCSTQGISINPRYTNGLLHVDIWFIDYASYENSIGIGRQAPVGSRLLASVRRCGKTARARSVALGVSRQCETAARATCP